MTKIELIEEPQQHYTMNADGDYEDVASETDNIGPDIVECALCDTEIGWVEYTTEDTYGRESEGYRWVVYYEVTRDGDAEPTLLCEDDAVWISEVGPDLGYVLS